ncbi:MULTISPECIES: STAS/SEC14 domain-containing protein [unclassified Sphingomonas]|uniref:STAS/SEC14 domain-containing protein n=1 Tax=unclassified Sphingomonas TaxID=196159 RepID=UPI002269E668|nr:MULTISPECIES: STAS/SEC14 domain-containing protein [unclassified Sphingomonas]
MYRIAVDRRRGLVEVTLGGLLSVEETTTYINDLRRAFVVNKLRAPYSMVVDVSACNIQAQDMIKAMGEHMVSMPKATAIAIVTGSSLARMQIRRLFTQPYARIVSTQEEAHAWIHSGVEPLEQAVC